MAIFTCLFAWWQNNLVSTAKYSWRWIQPITSNGCWILKINWSIFTSWCCGVCSPTSCWDGCVGSMMGVDNWWIWIIKSDCSAYSLSCTWVGCTCNFPVLMRRREWNSNSPSADIYSVWLLFYQFLLLLQLLLLLLLWLILILFRIFAQDLLGFL